MRSEVKSEKDNLVVETCRFVLDLMESPHDVDSRKDRLEVLKRRKKKDITHLAQGGEGLWLVKAGNIGKEGKEGRKEGRKEGNASNVMGVHRHTCTS
jgi:hypothetical protein